MPATDPSYRPAVQVTVTRATGHVGYSLILRTSWALLAGATPRRRGMARGDLLAANSMRITTDELLRERTIAQQLVLS